MPEIVEVRRYVSISRVKLMIRNYQVLKLLVVGIKNTKPQGWDELLSQLPIKIDKVQSKGKMIYFTIGSIF